MKGSKAAYIPLVITFILALVLRLYHFTDGYGLFGDQGQDLLAANKWIHYGQIPLVGIKTSNGLFHMGPLYYYLITPITFALKGDPIAPVLLFLLSGLLLVIISYLLVLKFADIQTAFILSFLIAISPHAIFLSKGAYSPNLQIFMSLLAIFLFLQFLKTERYIYLFAVLLSVGVGIQFHYMFLANLLIFSIMTALFKRDTLLNYRLYLASISGFLIPLIPFLVGQVFLRFEDLKGIYFYLFQGGQFRFMSWQTIMDRLTFPFTIYLLPENLPWYLNFSVKLFFAIILVLSFLIARSKTHLNFLAKFFLIYFLLGVFISTLASLNFWWWYYDYFSISSLALVAILISYLFHYSKIKYSWLPVLAIFTLWITANLSDIYKLARSPQIVKETSGSIISDLKRKKINQDIGIYTVKLVSDGQGFEYRYFLEKEGIKTHTSLKIEDADYIIVEKPYTSSKPKDRSMVVQSTQVYVTQNPFIKSIE